MELVNNPHIIIDDKILIPLKGDLSAAEHKFWAKVFDFHYEKIIDLDNAIDDTSVWKNSYNGEIFPKEEMDDWIQNAVSKIKNLLTPESKILEIGCGNGLIFSSIIREVKSYTGIDIATTALSSIGNSDLGKQFKNKITLHELAADAIYTLTGEFDLIIINSVAQYFPDLNYFFDLISKMENKLSETGCIFLGDIRSFDLADIFYDEIAKYKFPDDDNKAKAFSVRTKAKDSETLYSQKLFQSLPSVFSWIKTVKISKKISSFSNEMSRFRFDVVIGKSGEENKTLEFTSVLKLSNHISSNVSKDFINQVEYEVISLHPTFFLLAQLYEKTR